MNVVLSETRETPTCAMAYNMDSSANLTESFKKMAPSLGIDLAAKKAHYDVYFNAPPVTGETFFSAFDK